MSDDGKLRPDTRLLSELTVDELKTIMCSMRCGRRWLHPVEMLQRGARQRRRDNLEYMKAQSEVKPSEMRSIVRFLFG